MGLGASAKDCAVFWNPGTLCLLPQMFTTVHNVAIYNWEKGGPWFSCKTHREVHFPMHTQAHVLSKHLKLFKRICYSKFLENFLKIKNQSIFSITVKPVILWKYFLCPKWRTLTGDKCSHLHWQTHSPPDLTPMAFWKCGCIIFFRWIIQNYHLSERVYQKLMGFCKINGFTILHLADCWEIEWVSEILTSVGSSEYKKSTCFKLL